MNRNFIKIIDVAKSGDSKAYEDLYNMTKDSAYFVALSITKNEQDAMDILQDSYIKAFNNLSTLRQPEVFDSWLNRIVANNSKKYISKNKPLLFGDISNDIPNLYEDESKKSDNTPHEIIDNKETSRMVMDIIENLSEDKRLIVIMYYYQEMLVKEISETLDLPVTTVKYKLLAARQDMKKDILNLEKKGLKLYSAAPLAIISSAMISYVASLEVPVFASVLPAVVSGVGGVAGAVVIGSSGAMSTSAVAGATVTGVAEGTAVAGAAVTGAATTGAAASTAGAVVATNVAGGVAGFLSTIGGKVVATTLAVAVVSGGTAVAVVNNNAKDNKPTEIVTTVISDLEQDISEENILENTTSEPITDNEEETILEETSEVKEEIPASEVVNMTTEGYGSMESIKIWSDFKVQETDELVDGLTETKVSITGSYPLSKSDIADTIVIESVYRDYSYIEINGVKKRFRGDIIFDAEIIDIDSEDEYKEVVVYDHGPSADPNIHIFRFVDDSIVEIGRFSAKYKYDEILFNGKGRIISGLEYLYFLNTEIVTGFTEVKGDVVNTYYPDYTELLDKKYTLSEDIEVEFSGEPILTDPTYIYNRPKIEEGTEIKLLGINIDKDSHYISDYIVELPDGSVKEMSIPFGD
ncbi:MAG: sigma-70 family RNA polymerase sigma factor [Lachnospiraceae bacterium]|nr:sigma-70 family RNA polymerase sigma factor [Lachnospiraceae bacterium]